MPFSEFHKGDGKHGLRSRCKRCINEDRRAAPGKSAMYRRANLRRYYDMTPERYQEMHIAQAGKCLLCGCPEEFSVKGRLVVDHDHKTGEVRGLLCGLCNSGIGKLKDDPALLRKAAAYLERA